jgi:type I restriction enzyme S subunit
LAGVPILRINNIKGGAIDTSDLKHIDLRAKAISSLLLSDGDILVIRTSGSGDLVGTCAVFHEQGEFVFASYLIRMVVDRGIAHPDYVGYFLNCSLGRQQVEAMSRHIMQNNINSEELRSIELPLPPLPVQCEIVAKMMAKREEIKSLKAEAERKAEQAKTDVNAIILGDKRVTA